jgi:hypothetical protein
VPPRSRIHRRGRYTRTSGDLLLNSPDGWLTDGLHGPVWWVGLDDWGRNGAIGPHGPYRHGAAGLPAVTRATSLIAGTLAMLPWRIVVGALQQPEDAPRWVTDPMLVRPDARLGPSATPAAVRLIRPVFWGS